jgi:hypothetical protein
VIPSTEKTGFIPETDIRPVQTLFDIGSLNGRKQADMINTGRQHLSKTVNIKLNGGLGTSMDLNGPKSLLKVKSLLSFLDIAVLQNRHLNPDVPLIFMNSFSTRPDTLEALAAYPWLQESALAIDFIQHKVPKVDATLLGPAEHPENTDLEWCPPGHGDVYAALVGSGMLDQLLENGYEYAFLSNIDNLGAVIDPAILGYFIENNFSFMMETAERTANDKKGGHLARSKSGGYLLREIAQCPQNDEDMQAFQDIQIDLDPAYYKFIDDFENRFSSGTPSLKNCHYLTVQGDFAFGKDLIFTKDTMLINTTGNRFKIDDHQRFFGGSVLVTDAIKGTHVIPVNKSDKSATAISVNKTTDTREYSEITNETSHAF